MLRLLGVNRYPIECLCYGIVQRTHLTFTSFRSMQKDKRRDNVLRQAVPQQHTAYRLRCPWRIGWRVLPRHDQKYGLAANMMVEPVINSLCAVTTQGRGRLLNV